MNSKIPGIIRSTFKIALNVLLHFQTSYLSISVLFIQYIFDNIYFTIHCLENPYNIIEIILIFLKLSFYASLLILSPELGVPHSLHSIRYSQYTWNPLQVHLHGSPVKLGNSFFSQYRTMNPTVAIRQELHNSFVCNLFISLLF